MAWRCLSGVLTARSHACLPIASRRDRSKVPLTDVQQPIPFRRAEAAERDRARSEARAQEVQDHLRSLEQQLGAAAKQLHAVREAHRMLELRFEVQGQSCHWFLCVVWVAKRCRQSSRRPRC